MASALTAFLVGMGCSSLPSGLAGDRWGTVRVLMVFFGLTAAAALGCGLSESFGAFLVAHAMLGVAAGLFHPAGLGLLSLSVESNELGSTMGKFGVIGSLGMIFMPFMVNSSLGWRAGYLGLAGGAAAMLVVCVALSRAGVLIDERPPEEQQAKLSGPSLLNWRVALTLLLGAMGVNAFLSSGWESIYLETIRDVGLIVLEDKTVASGVLVVGALGQYVGGLLARDAFTASRYAVILVLQALVLLGTATALDRSMLPFMLLGSFAFFNTMTMPMENRLLAGYTSTRRRSTAYAFKFVVALLIAAPAPWLAHEFYDGVASQPVYRLLSLAGLVGVFAGYFFLRSTRVVSSRR
jgi:MFS family permease